MNITGCATYKFHSRWYAAQMDCTTDYLSSFERTKGNFLTLLQLCIEIN